MSATPFQLLTNDISVHKIVQLLKITESAERYQDMCYLAKKLVILKFQNNQSLDDDERNLLSVAFKNVLGATRASWRTLAGGLEDFDSKLTDQYKNIISIEIETICLEMINLLQNYLIKNDCESHINRHYFHMCAAYNRYLSEIYPDNPEYKNKSEYYFEKAMECLNLLPPTHPTRLGMALSYATQFYEILKQPEKACDIAKKAFDEAIEHLDELDENDYKDSTLIMQLLRDNLTLWTSQISEEEQKELDRKEREKKEKERKQAVILIDGYVRNMRNILQIPNNIIIPNIINRICVIYYFSN